VLIAAINKVVAR